MAFSPQTSADFLINIENNLFILGSNLMSLFENI
jgi:hypothetical protein